MSKLTGHDSLDSQGSVTETFGPGLKFEIFHIETIRKVKEIFFESVTKLWFLVYQTLSGQISHVTQNLTAY